MATLNYTPPVEVIKRPGEPLQKARRRANNASFKQRAQYRARGWSKPTLYRHAFEEKQRRRKEHRENAPNRLAYMVMMPLIRRYQQQRWPVQEFLRVPENDFDFWVHWLNCFLLVAVPCAAGFNDRDFTTKKIQEPIARLITALTDCRDGVRSRYTESFFTKKTRGRKRDSEEIAQFKSGIGTAYRVLSSVGLCSRVRAIKIVQRQMRQLGYIEIPAQNIQDYGRRVPEDKYKQACSWFMSGLFHDDNNRPLSALAYGTLTAGPKRAEGPRVKTPSNNGWKALTEVWSDSRPILIVSVRSEAKRPWEEEYIVHTGQNSDPSGLILAGRRNRRDAISCCDICFRQQECECEFHILRRIPVSVRPLHRNGRSFPVRCARS